MDPITQLVVLTAIAGAARDAVPLGYEVIVADDACATRDITGDDGKTVPRDVLHQASLATLSDTFAALADRSGMGTLLEQAHPTVDHYLPALTIAGASDAKDSLSFLNEGIDLGSISMRSFIFH